MYYLIYSSQKSSDFGTLCLDCAHKDTEVGDLPRVVHLVKGQRQDSNPGLASILSTVTYHFQKNWTSFLSIRKRPPFHGISAYISKTSICQYG